VAPPWALKQVLILVAKFLPREKLVPQKDLADLGFKERKKKDQVLFRTLSIVFKLTISFRGAL
jgi:caffeoylshikimate esterase